MCRKPESFIFGLGRLPLQVWSYLPILKLG